MAKHCTNCGHELRDTDKFCAECGTPIGDATSQSLPTKWEYCEITVEEWTKVHYLRTDEYFFRYWAEALGSNGKYSVGQSDVIITENTSFAARDAALNAFIAKLVSDGWEPLPNKGAYAYSYKFRRPVKG